MYKSSYAHPPFHGNQSHNKDLIGLHTIDVPDAASIGVPSVMEKRDEQEVTSNTGSIKCRRFAIG